MTSRFPAGGFSTAYERVFDAMFSALDRVEARLSQSRYLVSANPTEPDWHSFTTLVRFDAVYYLHFH